MKTKRKSPAQQSLKMLRDEGWFCAVTERWNAFAKVRQDLFGFIDVLAMKSDMLLAVQTTSGDNVASRVQKIRETQAASLWLESPNRLIVVHGWSKRGERGKRKLWDCRQVWVTKESL